MKTIVWDVDDVLNDLMRVWFEEFWRPKHPDTKMEYETINLNPPHQLFETSKEEYLASLDEFRLSGRYDRLEPIKEVKSWFLAHGAKFRHVALTRVPVAVAHVSAAWVLKHYGQWIRSFHFIPSYRAGERPPVYDENKGTSLHYFGKADLLIDDTIENIEAAEKYSVKTLVFPRPWNKSRQTISQSLDEILNLV